MIGAKLDRWIHDTFPVSAEGLSTSRILYASFFLLMGIPTFSWVSANPPGFFTAPPLSLAAFSGGFPPVAVVRALDVSIGILFVFVLTGFKTRASSSLLSLSLILGYSFRYSFGKIDHDTILAVLTPGIMAFAGWGSRFSIDARRRSGTENVAAWPVTLLALLVGFGFLSAGLPKLRVWVDFDVSTHGAREWLLNGWYVMGRRRLLAPYLMTVDNPYFWEGLDLAAVAFEVGFIFSLARRELFQAYLLVAMAFHSINLLMLNIPFAAMIPVYAVFAPWDDALGRLPRVTRVLGAVGTFATMAVLLVLFLPLYLLVGRVPVDTAANSFSHLGILAGLAGVDSRLFGSLLAWAAALGAGLAFAGTPRRAGRAPAGIGVKGRPAVFFDGVCNLCNGFVDFLIHNDRVHALRFASLQSDIGEKVVEAASAAEGRRRDDDTVYFVDRDGWIYERSDAVLRSLLSLGRAFRLLSVFWMVPRVVRDVAYRGVSRFRYRLFGRRASCRLPTPEEKALFV